MNLLNKTYLRALGQAVEEENPRIVITRVKRAERFKREKIVFTLDNNYVHSSVLHELFGFDIYQRLTLALPITYDEELFNKLHKFEDVVRDVDVLLRALKDFI